MKKIYQLIAIVAVLVCQTACEKDKFTDSIFIDPVEKEDSYTRAFDKWLDSIYVKPYKVDFRYKLDDNATDPNYNVVPVRLGMADSIAHLALYLWYDVYDEVVDTNFIRENGPRIIQLIGSAMINAAQGTEKLGQAEGGIKITLMKVNSMEPDNMEQLNEYIFKTMHHEFSHILHQKRAYPKEFGQINPGDYDQDGWQYRTYEDAWKLGFVSNYGSSQEREDFVETIANYIVKTDTDWQHMLEVAGTVGRPIIEQKLSICREWLMAKWGVDLDALHAEVQSRQEHLDWGKIMNLDF